MNLLRPQAPYRFMPPKYSPAFRPFLHLLTKLSLRFEFEVGEVSISGLDRVTKPAKQGHSVLVAPNHADHADPGLMVTAARRGGFAFHFMAAREGFERHRLHYQQCSPTSSGATCIRPTRRSTSRARNCATGSVST